MRRQLKKTISENKKIFFRKNNSTLNKIVLQYHIDYKNYMENYLKIVCLTFIYIYYNFTDINKKN